jgi:hypothetical protein
MRLYNFEYEDWLGSLVIKVVDKSPPFMDKDLNHKPLNVMRNQANVL